MANFNDTYNYQNWWTFFVDFQIRRRLDELVLRNPIAYFSQIVAVDLEMDWLVRLQERIIHRRLDWPLFLLRDDRQERDGHFRFPITVLS